MKKNYNVVDMFCGAGGESTGIMQAAQEQDMKVNLLAINHWERAMETHAANYPSAEHLCESVEKIDPTKAVPGGKLDLLWASPECTHYSVARGGRPCSDQSRASAWLILKWLSELFIERVIIENVAEFMSWGPLDDKGRPIKNQKGKTFRAFISSIRSLGYTVDWRVLNAADYGDPTTRKRLFIQAVRGRKRILWPEITHIENCSDNQSGYQKWRPAREIIDWDIPGTSIFDRKKPLADATIRRIAAGIEKYWKDYAKPFLAVLYGTSTVKSLNDPLTAISCVPHHALVEPVPLLMGHESGQMPKPINDPVQTVLAQGRINLIQPLILGQQSCAAARPIEQPIPTIATAGAISLIQPFITSYHGEHKEHKNSSAGIRRNHKIENPLPCVDTSNRYALVEPFLLPNEGFYRGNKARSLDKPLSTITASRGFGGIVSSESDGVKLDIRFRMLKNHELKQAQGFSRDYIITGNTTEQTRQIGNAVPPGLAKALSNVAMKAARRSL
jgi:DNA (cytosine-5)-methyltransferase 1